MMGEIEDRFLHGMMLVERDNTDNTQIKDGKTKAEIWIMEVPVGIIVPMQINGVSMTEKKIELARKWRSKKNDNHR